jgi:hypothetical protein
MLRAMPEEELLQSSALRAATSCTMNEAPAVCPPPGPCGILKDALPPDNTGEIMIGCGVRLAP